MKRLLRKPFLLALLLSLPLWIVFNNFIVAFSVALLISFLISMINSIVAIRRQQRRIEQPDTTSDPRS